MSNYHNMENHLYKYKPLNTKTGDIRLVRIHAAQSPDESIHCTIHQAPISSLPHYEALSYTWGPSTLNSTSTSTSITPIITNPTITLNSQAFPVTQNLHAALSHLRYLYPKNNVCDVNEDTKEEEDHDRMIWIDAICINQNDITERNLQVKRMVEIYGWADRVIVWIGESDASSDSAIDFVNSATTTTSTNTNSIFNSTFSGNRNNGLLKSYENLVNSILNRGWWRRVWVVQEVAVAKVVRVKCGEKEMDWDRLLRFVRRARRFPLNPSDPGDSDSVSRREGSEDQRTIKTTTTIPCRFAILIDDIRLKYQTQGSLPLFRLLSKVRSLNATLPHDKVYAVLGISQQTHALNPDYKKPILEVFASVAKLVFETEQRLDSLCLGTSFERRSWVTDLTVPWEDMVIPFKGREHDLIDSFNASGGVGMDICFSDDLSLMTVSGIRKDEIGYVVPFITSFQHEGGGMYFWPGNEYSDRFLQYYLSLFEKSGERKYGDDDGVRLALAKTFTADRMVDHDWGYQRLPPDKHFGHYIPQVYDEEPNQPNQPSRSSNPEKSKSWNLNADRMRLPAKTLRSRTIMLSREGYICLVPETSREGDLIVVLFGCDTPLVLRKFGERYRLIGECYLHGIMDGEVISDLDKGLLSKQTFVLE